MGAVIRLVVVDDHALVREGLCHLLRLEADFQIVGECAGGHEAVAMVRALKPDVVIMDLAMRGLNGLDAVRQLRDEKATCRVLMLSAYGDDAYLQRAREVGVQGYIVKQRSIHDLCKAIRKVSRGGTYPDAALGCRTATADGGLPAILTARESSLLQLVAEGRSNKEAASILGLSIKTIEKHRGSLMRKLGIHDTAGLTRHALAMGVVEARVNSNPAVLERR